jgi:hypothetical protein
MKKIDRPLKIDLHISEVSILVKVYVLIKFSKAFFKSVAHDQNQENLEFT